MSDCLHCDIHERLESHLQSEQADLAEIAAKVTEVLADLIIGMTIRGEPAFRTRINRATTLYSVGPGPEP